MLVPVSPGSLRSCEEIAVFSPARMIPVPRLRRLLRR